MARKEFAAKAVGFVVPARCLCVPWNNRHQLNPSNFGPHLCEAYREYFASPSRMYTAKTEKWRRMYGDGCEDLCVRKPGTQPDRRQYGFAQLRDVKPEAAGVSVESPRSLSPSSPGLQIVELDDLDSPYPSALGSPFDAVEPW